jgi:hypothetical protein
MTLAGITTRTVTTPSDYGRRLNEFINDVAIPEQRAAIVRGVARSIPDLVAASPVDTGLYAQSWHFTETERAVLIGNSAPHAPVIEFGARPFTPPLAPLLAWAKRVLQDPSQPPEYSDAVWALAVGTQKKIAAQGMQPRHILTNMLDSIVDNIVEELQAIG